MWQRRCWTGCNALARLIHFKTLVAQLKPKCCCAIPSIHCRAYPQVAAFRLPDVASATSVLRVCSGSIATQTCSSSEARARLLTADRRREQHETVSSRDCSCCARGTAATKASSQRTSLNEAMSKPSYSMHAIQTLSDATRERRLLHLTLNSIGGQDPAWATLADEAEKRAQAV